MPAEKCSTDRRAILALQEVTRIAANIEHELLEETESDQLTVVGILLGGIISRLIGTERDTDEVKTAILTFVVDTAKLVYRMQSHG